MKRWIVLCLVILQIVLFSGCRSLSDDTPKNTQDGDKFATALSYANWTEDFSIYFGALNNDTFAISRTQHLPIYKFETPAELDRFRDNFSDIFSMEHGMDEVPSFCEPITAYDADFFEDNTLFLVYVGASNSTHRFGLEQIYCDGTNFCLHLKETTGAECVDEAMAGWFLTVAVPKETVAGCTEFDADLNALL